MDLLSLRNMILVVGGLPSVVLLVVCALAAAEGSSLVATTALTGLVPTLALTLLVTTVAVRRLDGLISRTARLASAADSEPEASGRGDRLTALAGLLDEVEQGMADLRDPPRRPDELTTGEIVASLAERSRALIDQQLAHIDWLEATEQVPERLEQLFELDHLAHRLRRSTESMAIAGGGDPTPYSGGPTPITDILRVAIGAVEAYRAVRLVAVDDVLIAGQPGYELAQLVAELVDNATRFTSDDETIEVLANGLDDGDYRITVIDHGVGMDPFLLDTTNRVVSDPPVLDEGVGDAIGLVVVGRLARRIGATVELGPTPGTGVTVQVVVPSSIIVADVPGRPSRTSEARSAKREHRRRGVRRRSSAPSRPPTDPRPSPSGQAPSPIADNVAPLVDVPPVRPGNQEEAALSTGAGWRPPPPAARGDRGLARRTRGANRGPITAGRRVHVSTRPPEEVRSMITRYRDGLRGIVDEVDEAARDGHVPDSDVPDSDVPDSDVPDSGVPERRPDGGGGR